MPLATKSSEEIPLVDWPNIDTVLLDMDGTLLDLHYDNTLWNQLVPRHYGVQHALDEDAAREHLYGHMHGLRATLDFYCLDYWARFTGLDIVALHQEPAALLSFRPGAVALLEQLRRHNKHLWLVTNAHRDSLAVKHQHTGVCDHLDSIISSHDFGAPKEDGTFWAKMAEQYPFDPARSIMIDDNEQVLDAAEQHGIAGLFTITQPDSGRPPRTDLRFPTIDHFGDITPA